MPWETGALFFHWTKKIMSTFQITPQELAQLSDDRYLAPLVPLIRKFGTNFSNGNVAINLHRPVMPDPSQTRWRKLPFNGGDALIDLIWDVFQYHKPEGAIFDRLRVEANIKG